MDTPAQRWSANWPANWPDWANLLLGVWLIVSPFILGFGEFFAAAGVFCGFGIVVTMFAAFALGRPETWEEGVNMIVGLCLIASPWLFNFSADRTLTLNALIGGVVVVGLAVWAMMRTMPGDHWWTHHHRTH